MRRRGRGFDDADERDRRFGRDFIEDDVRRVGGDDAELGAGAGECLDRGDKVPRREGEIIGDDRIANCRKIDIVNDELRVNVASQPFAIKTNNGLVVIDGAFRSQPADYSKRLQLKMEPLRVLGRFVVKSNRLRPLPSASVAPAIFGRELGNFFAPAETEPVVPGFAHAVARGEVTLVELVAFDDLRQNAAHGEVIGI